MKHIVESFHTIGVMGIAKNTGKTTTLNYLIDQLSADGLFITSIGLDGEAFDQINDLPKPRIRVKKGMKVATTTECLKESTAIYQVDMKTGLATALGEVVIVEILEDGYMLVAGPTTNQELNQLLTIIKPLSKHILVDGAFNRMTFATIDLIDGMILASGAAYDHQMSQTIKKTESIVRLFSSIVHPSNVSQEHKLMIMTQANVYAYHDKKIHPFLAAHTQEKIERMIVKGAITSSFIQSLVKSRLKHFDLIADDPTKFLFDAHEFEYLDQLDIRLGVRKSIALIAITINPFSPNGLSYDKDVFLETMKAHTHLPVYNIKQLEESHE